MVLDALLLLSVVPRFLFPIVGACPFYHMPTGNSAAGAKPRLDCS